MLLVSCTFDVNFGEYHNDYLSYACVFEFNLAGTTISEVSITIQWCDAKYDRCARDNSTNGRQPLQRYKTTNTERGWSK